MFQLTATEAENLRFHLGISSSGHGGRRYLPYAFTEQGVAMLSSVLRSTRAVQVNLAIMRTFLMNQQCSGPWLSAIEHWLSGEAAAIPRVAV
jgi:hypothetical protein